MGEIEYMAAENIAAEGDKKIPAVLADSMRRFLRSVELCDDYLRGYYGLKLVSDRMTSFHLQQAECPRLRTILITF